MYTVYKHTNNQNGKVYIGITSKKPEYRWNSGKNYSNNEHFFSAINKYGWDNFSHEILFENLIKEEAEEKEIQLIKEYNSTDENFGYNLSPGGNYTPSSRMKKINCYDLNGHFLKTYNSVTEAREELHVFHIYDCCSGKFQQVGNYTFRYLSEDFPANKDIPFSYKENIKDVNFYDLNGTYLFTVHGLKKAAKISGIHPFNISECCNFRHYKAGNYVTRFLSEEFPIDKNIDFNYNEIKENTIKKIKAKRKTRGPLPKHSKEILQFTKEGEFIKEWSSVSEACKVLPARHAGSVANGNRKLAGGYIWKWKSDVDKKSEKL